MHITVIIAVFMALLLGPGDPPVDEGPFPAAPFDPGAALLLVAGTSLIFWALTRITARMLLRRLQLLGWSQLGSLRLPGRVGLISTVSLLCLFFVQLRYIGWARLVHSEWELGRFVLADEVALILPFVLLQLLKWHCFYPVNRYIKEYVVAGQLVEGIATRPVWSLGEYMIFHLRHGLLIVLAPLLLIFGLHDTIEWSMTRWLPEQENLSTIIEVTTAAGAVAIFVLSPLLLRHVWVTRSLPEGPLRGRLLQFCRHLRLRHRDILLWDTYGAVANAAVMGLLPPVRYVLLSDALIENMPDEQIEAVFAHEAGHVRHHHILFLVLFVLGAGATGLSLVQLAAHAARDILANDELFAEYSQWIVSGASVAAFVAWASLFGYVSRRFECQADVHAACNCGSAAEPESASDNEDDKLEVPGAGIMAAALDRIALLNGVSPQARSWRHSSIAGRSAFLKRLAQTPGLLQRFQRKVIITKALIVLTVLVGGGGLWWLDQIAT